MDSIEPTTSSGASRSCCIHLGDVKVSEEIKLFGAETFKKCQLALCCRRKYNLKFSDIQFPHQDYQHLGYHTSCYRKITAIKKDKIDTITASDIKNIIYKENLTIYEKKSTEENNQRPTRSKNFLNTSILKRSCIFCNKVFVYKDKKRIRLSACQTKVFENKIKRYAIALNDQELLSKIRNIDFIAKEIHYRRICRTKYSMKFINQSQTKNKCTDWHIKRAYHKQAMDKLQNYI